jgi:putative endonuclease
LENNKRRIGALGERAAAEFYVSQGFDILKTNWRYKRLGEVDIIAGKGDVIVFSEVKFRSEKKFSQASEAVNFDKQRRIRKLPEIFTLQNCSLYGEKYVRFDVAEVYSCSAYTKSEISGLFVSDDMVVSVIENAF